MTDVQITSLNDSLGREFPALEDKWDEKFDTLKYEFLKKSDGEQTRILTNLDNNVEKSLFLEFVSDHIDTLDGKTDEEVVSILYNMSEKLNKGDDNRIFTNAEAMISGDRVSHQTSSDFSKICTTFARLTNNPYYKLFADFSEIYSSTDNDKLEGYLKQLRQIYSYSATDEDRYYVLYLSCLCLQRMCLNSTNRPINREWIDFVYGNFIAKNSLDIDYTFEEPSTIYYVEKNYRHNGEFDIELNLNGGGEQSVTLDFGKIISKNYLAICRLFVTDNHFFSHEIEESLANLCKHTKEMVRYNKRDTPIISEKLSFCLFRI
ncbi:hypothetical protein [Huintestinicola sp.]|uniref:hypothetical protein n=1 Tax=Huintestinicola sp. TaxID=2981661 RepID=UPI003D7E126D